MFIKGTWWRREKTDETSTGAIFRPPILVIILNVKVDFKTVR